jgi:hypothetical protein
MRLLKGRLFNGDKAGFGGDRKARDATTRHDSGTAIAVRIERRIGPRDHRAIRNDIR